MGSAAVQGDLWGARAKDWSEIGEAASIPAFEMIFSRLDVGPGKRVLDIGCGSGTALTIAQRMGAEPFGIDAADPLVAIGRARLPAARIEVGDMEDLPFDDRFFDAVTGFNSFQFAADMPRALQEARRVCRGAFAIFVWGKKQECE